MAATDSPRSAAAPRRRPSPERLPATLRAVRVAELLFFPVVGFLLLGLPTPHYANPEEMLATFTLAAEAFAAVAVFVGLGRRRRWAWWLTLVLAAFVLVRLLLVAPGIVAAAERSTVGFAIVALLAWTFLTQAVALLCALALRNRKGELR
jgi:hypothetical protein